MGEASGDELTSAYGVFSEKDQAEPAASGPSSEMMESWPTLPPAKSSDIQEIVSCTSGRELGGDDDQERGSRGEETGTGLTWVVLRHHLEADLQVQQDAQGVALSYT